jgi:hypothetical protein
MIFKNHFAKTPSGHLEPEAAKSFYKYNASRCFIFKKAWRLGGFGL